MFNFKERSDFTFKVRSLKYCNTVTDIWTFIYYSYLNDNTQDLHYVDRFPFTIMKMSKQKSIDRKAVK